MSVRTELTAAVVEILWPRAVRIFRAIANPSSYRRPTELEKCVKTAEALGLRGAFVLNWQYEQQRHRRHPGEALRPMDCLQVTCATALPIDWKK